MKISDISKMPGVADLKPFTARAKFSQALAAEMSGEPDKAQQCLDEAVALAR